MLFVQKDVELKPAKQKNPNTVLDNTVNISTAELVQNKRTQHALFY